MRRLVPLAALAVAACAAPAPCHHTLRHVELYPDTVDGPRALAAIVADPAEPEAVRIAAARALVTLDRRDHDVTRLLVDAFRGARDPAIEEALVVRVVEALHEDPLRNGDTEGARVVAKDRAVALAPHVSESARGRLRDAVIDWHLRELARRRHLGRVDLDDAFAAFGLEDRSALLESLGPQSGPENLRAALDLLADAPPSTGRRAAARLLETEAALRQQAFAAWLRDGLREAVRDRGAEELSPERLEAAVALNRRNFIDGVLQGLRRFCAQPAVADRLSAIAVDDPEEDLRVRALQALEGCATARHVGLLLSLAFDASTPLRVRDYAFDRLAEVEDPRIAARLWRELPTADDGPLGWRLRWRVGALLLVRADAGAVPRFLEALPGDGEYAHEELVGYAERLAALGAAAQPALRDALRSERWFVRVIALLALPVAEGAALRDDDAALRGAHWEPLETVGDVAGRRRLP